MQIRYFPLSLLSHSSELVFFSMDLLLVFFFHGSGLPYLVALGIMQAKTVLACYSFAHRSRCPPEQMAFFSDPSPHLTGQGGGRLGAFHKACEKGDSAGDALHIWQVTWSNQLQLQPKLKRIKRGHLPINNLFVMIRASSKRTGVESKGQFI